MADSNDNLNNDGAELVQYQAYMQTAGEILAGCAPHQRAILRLFAACELNGIDPEPLLQGLGHEVSVRKRQRFVLLSMMLNDGVAPIEALEKAPRLLPPSSVLALRLAKESGRLDVLYTAIIDQSSDQSLSPPSHEDVITARLFRLFGKTVLILSIISFVMLKIVPEFRKMFEEFGLEIPRPMMSLMEVCSIILPYAGIIPIVICLWIVLQFSALRQYLGRWNPSTWQRHVSPAPVERQRALAMLAQADQPIASGIASVEKKKPFRNLMKKFSKAKNKMAQGTSVWDSLASTSVISRRDAKALSQTSSNETQAWLLRWSANNRESKSATNTAFWFRVFVAAVHIGLGLFVRLTAIAVFSTMTSLIGGMQ